MKKRTSMMAAMFLAAVMGASFGANAQAVDTRVISYPLPVHCLLYTSPSPRDRG